MLRTHNDKLMKIDMAKYKTDALYYKSLWILKYNLNIDKTSDIELKNKLKAKLVKKKI